LDVDAVMAWEADWRVGIAGRWGWWLHV
jgi:hypothetical protein